MLCHRLVALGPALCGLVALAACGAERQQTEAPVTRLSPPQLQLCTESVLAERAIRTEVAPLEVDSGAWRLRLTVLDGSPPGWLGKGDLVHDGARVTYLPDGATEGLFDERIFQALVAISERCMPA